MPTATDTDLCQGLDGSEVLTIPRVLVTGMSIGDGAGSPTLGLVEFDAGAVFSSPGIGGPSGIYENPAISQVNAGVMIPVYLPDSLLAYASTFTYTITLKIAGFPDQVYSAVEISRERFPSQTCDLSQLI